MNWGNDIHHKRAKIGTTVFTILLFIYLLFFGLTYLDPAPIGGITLSFGYDDAGSNNTTAAPPPSKSTPPTPVEPVTETIDDVVTQDAVDAVSVNDQPKKDPQPEKPKEEVKEPVKETPKETVKEDPKPTDQLSKALGDISNQPDEGSGEGDNQTGGGDHGKPEGDRDSQNREGTGGSGNGNYMLDGRGAVYTPKPKNDCIGPSGNKERGRVVVKVYVDRNGNVVNAVAGESVKGINSTTTNSCLLSRAKEAAMKTKWTAKSDALEQQVGFIIYNFELK